MEWNEETRIKKKNEEKLRNLWENFKCSNSWIIGVPEEEEEQEIENLFEKNNEGELPQSTKGSRLPWSPGSSESPKKVGFKEAHTKARHNTFPTIKHKERILKPSIVKKAVTYKGVPKRLSADLSKETLQARRGWEEVFKVMRGKDLYPKLIYPAKLSFRMEEQIKCFPDKVKLKEFNSTKPLLYEKLKGQI